MKNYKREVSTSKVRTNQNNKGNKKYYKAKITSNKMKIRQEDKDALVRLVIFATTLDRNIDENEAKRTIEMIAEWKTRKSKDIKTVADLETLKNQGWAKEHLSDFIAIMVNILADSDFFDNQEANKKILEGYSDDFKDKVPRATEEEINRIKFSNKDYAAQFYGVDRQTKMSKAEEYSNLMYLANQLSHVFAAINTNTKTWMEHHTIEHITNELRKIKDWCIHKLIEEKEKGEPIDIAIGKDLKEKSSFNGIISFVIPNYMEPFVIHYNSSILSEKELAVCDGTERYISKGLKTTFPQYLTDEKMELLQKLYAYSSEPTRKGYAHNRDLKLEWLFDTKKILDRLVKRQLKNSPVKEETKQTAVKTKTVDIQRENAETLKALELNLGISFPDYFKEGFLKRTSYSLAKYMKIVGPEVKSYLTEKGIPQENADKEFAKLMVYMKMVKPLSVIYLKSSDEKVHQALDCLDEYGTIYEQIICDLPNNSSYSELRSKIRKQANQIIISKSKANTEELELHENPSIKYKNTSFERQEDEKIISLSETTIKELQMQIISLNQEITRLTTAINSLQKTIKLQEKKVKGLSGKNKTNEEKGDR